MRRTDRLLVSGPSVRLLSMEARTVVLDDPHKRSVGGISDRAAILSLAVLARSAGWARATEMSRKPVSSAVLRHPRYAQGSALLQEAARLGEMLRPVTWRERPDVLPPAERGGEDHTWRGDMRGSRGRGGGVLFLGMIARALLRADVVLATRLRRSKLKLLHFTDGRPRLRRAPAFVETETLATTKRADLEERRQKKGAMPRRSGEFAPVVGAAPHDPPDRDQERRTGDECGAAERPLRKSSRRCATSGYQSSLI